MSVNQTREASTDYHFIDRWRVRGAAEEVADILLDLTSYPRWWPASYIEVTRDEPGDQSGAGQTGMVHARGWMPFTLRSDYRVAESRPPAGFTLEAEGDLTGRGIWEIAQDGEWVDVVCTWRIRSDKAILHYLSFLLKPLFRTNHSWIMRQGERSLQIELDRRAATTQQERERVSAPPGPVPDALWVAGLGALLLFVWTLRRLRGRE